MLNLFLVHSYRPIPDRFMDSIIVLLVKCKGKYLPDINNYGAITLSNSITKVLEFVFLHHVNKNDKMSTIDSQFGFKAWLSTSLCTYSFKQTVAYYTGRHVFVCFVDCSKAFDKVNYWKLFKQLLDNVCLISLCFYWHTCTCLLYTSPSPRD